MKHPRPAAFTLIELLIVVAIIAILAAIAVPNFLEAQTRAKVSRTQSDLRTLSVAMESYVVDNNKYPTFFLGIREIGGPSYQAISGKVGEQQIYLLTTPIAYVTSIAADTFQATKPRHATNPQKGYLPDFGPAPRYYVYLPPQLIRGSTGWSIRSMGPDLDWDLIGDANDNDSTVPENGKYDTTNGTISNGDILRAGGGVSFFNSN